LAGDLDDLLATRRELLLGRWLADARVWATTDAERRLFEWNARTQITLWGLPDSALHEYARKEWSGMLRGFYGARWGLFLDRLDAALASGGTFDADRFARDVRVWEDRWTHEVSDEASCPAAPRGDAVAVARRLFAKYHSTLLDRDAVSLTTDHPATCSYALGPYPAYLANDGRARDTGSYWATDVNVSPQAWWQVDLERPTTVGRVVVVFFHGDERRYGFTVATSSDGRVWTTVADHRDRPQLATPRGVTCRFTPRAVRFIRVDITSNTANTGRHLVEVMAYDQ
jgi:hypothetical protein